METFPFVTALYRAPTFVYWNSLYLIDVFFEPKVATGDPICVIKIIPRRPSDVNKLCREIDDKIDALVKEMKSLGFDLQLLDKEFLCHAFMRVRFC